MTSKSAGSMPLIEDSKRAIFGIRLQWIDLLVLLVKRDLRVRYRGSVLGYLWSMLNPLMYMIILTLVFSHVVKLKADSYALFILSGIMGWNLLHQSIVIGMNSIIGSGHLLKKVNIPGLLFPTASVWGVMVNFGLSFIPFTIISLILNKSLSYTMVLVPLLVIPFVLFVWGLAVTIASINVKYRDVGHAMEPLMQMLFYASPVVYPVETIPERWRFIIELNPMTHFLTVFRGLMINNQIPSFSEIAIICTLALCAVILGLLTYRNTRAVFIYYL